MLVPTTTQGMSIVLSLKLCLFIQFRALELLLDLLNPAFGSIFGKPELDFLLIQDLWGTCAATPYLTLHYVYHCTTLASTCLGNTTLWSLIYFLKKVTISR